MNQTSLRIFGLWSISFCLLAPAATLASKEKDRQLASFELILTSAFSASPLAMEVKIDRDVCGKTRPPQTFVVSTKNQGLKNVMVALDWIAGTEAPTWPATTGCEGDGACGTIVSRNCEFEPRVTILKPGGTLFFENEDPVLQSMRAMAKNYLPLYRVLPPNLEKVQMRFDARDKAKVRAEVIPIVSDIHPWMTAFAVVADHPLYAVTDGDGRVMIKNIPPGSYRLRLWNEILGERIEKDPLVLEAKDKRRMSLDWTPTAENYPETTGKKLPQSQQ